MTSTNAEAEPIEASDQPDPSEDDLTRAEPLSLDAVLDIRAAGPLLDAVKARRGAALSINASGVDRIGAQCAQVLVSAQQTWTEDGEEFEIVAGSAGFLENLELMGLSERLTVKDGDA
ncbi:MAG: STAS domain-containing protein [Pseudomonadota bacterium]